ncbi:MAG TPA: S8 family peptidase [Dehalococcoidales bacterium]|nr:S8 family peptidase [Dehalococcoidales bacterium]
MFKSKFGRLLTIVVILAGLTLGPVAQVQAESPEPVDVLVTFYDSPGSDEVELIENLGGTVGAVYHIVPTIATTIPVDKLDVLSADPRVRLVEMDTQISGCIAEEVLPWGVDRVDAELVHPSNKGTGVKVAILDTGIDLDHPDLAVTDNVTFVPGTTDGDDDNGHGTRVAGIVAALDNDIGVIGVAPEASLYSVKVLNENGDGVMSVILSGIEWAVDNNMQVMNMSFGGSMEWPASLIEALGNAYDAGIVVVAGAGNGGNASGEGNNVWAPARYKPVIAVGATDQQDSRYTSSSTGYALELVAPGVNIYSTAMGGGYGYISATSASSPHSAGVAALLVASGMTNNVDVRHRLRDSVEDLGDSGWDTQVGCGMVNADLAINFTEPPDQSAPTTTISLSGTMGDYDWYVSDVEVTLTATDDGGSGVAETQYSLDSGETWNTYTSPFTITTEGSSFLVLARSWDSAGNDEGPPDFAQFKIDKTPPAVTETVDPTLINRMKKGNMVPVDYSGTAEDSLSGLPYAGTNTVLIDEYGVWDQDLGRELSGTVSVEAYCGGGDKDGRTYTIRLTAHDYAGNETSTDAIVTVVK